MKPVTTTPDARAADWTQESFLASLSVDERESFDAAVSLATRFFTRVWCPWDEFYPAIGAHVRDTYLGFAVDLANDPAMTGIESGLMRVSRWNEEEMGAELRFGLSFASMNPRGFPLHEPDAALESAPQGEPSNG